MTAKTTLLRLIFLIWGMAGLFGGGYGLLKDAAYYFSGVPVDAKIVDHTDPNHGKYDRAILEYIVDGQPYRLISIRGNFTIGETETVRYNSQNPAAAREGIWRFLFDLFWLVAGTIVLTARLYFTRRPVPPA